MKRNVLERIKLREEILEIIKEEEPISELGLMEWLHQERNLSYSLIENQLMALKKIRKINIYDGYITLGDLV